MKKEYEKTEYFKSCEKVSKKNWNLVVMKEKIGSF